MPAALEVLTGFTTAAGATPIAVTMATGNSNTIRAFDVNKLARLLDVYADMQVAGLTRIRSPKLHDAVQGIRLDTTISDVAPLLPSRSFQRLYTQDQLTIELAGSAVAGDIETVCLLIYYEDLPGIAARFIGIDELMRRTVNIFTVENTLALGTAGGYSGEEAINAEFDLGKNNVDYALVGYLVDVECATVRWRGADTGNLGVGGPGNETLRHVTKEWFIRLTERFGVPLIPVFNWANKAGILLDGAQDENGADTTVTSIFAELSPR